MSGIERIAAERKRQVEQEGWTPEHDDEHRDGSLLDAGICYVLEAGDVGEEVSLNPPSGWPPSWAPEWWKPESGARGVIEVRHAIRMLEKAGALIAAEIDRLERAQAREHEEAASTYEPTGLTHLHGNPPCPDCGRYLNQPTESGVWRYHRNAEGREEQAQHEDDRDGWVDCPGKAREPSADAELVERTRYYATVAESLAAQAGYADLGKGLRQAFETAAARIEALSHPVLTSKRVEEIRGRIEWMADFWPEGKNNPFEKMLLRGARDLLSALDAAAQREKIAAEALRFAAEFICDGHHIQFEPEPIRTCRTVRPLDRNSWCIPCRASEALAAMKEGE